MIWGEQAAKEGEAVGRRMAVSVVLDRGCA